MTGQKSPAPGFTIRRLFGDPRARWLMAAVCVFMVTSLVAFWQPVFPNPWEQAKPLSWEWWGRPIERNGFSRLTGIPLSPDNVDITSLPGEPDTLLVVGPDWLIRSEDGGWSWDQVNLPGLQNGGDGRFFFVDAQYGWLDDGGDQLFHTRDGGKSWVKQAGRPGFANNSMRLFFISRQKGWLVSEGLWKTEDSGATWNRIQVPSKGIFSGCFFLDENRGWLVGETTLKTVDGGKTWNEVPLKQATKVFFIDEQRGWASAAGGLATTQDGGLTWDLLEIGFDSRKDDFQVIDAKHFLIISNKRLMETVDGGANWVIRELPGVALAFPLTRPHFRDATHGWLLRQNTIFRTDDGGRTWVPQTRPYITDGYFHEEKQGMLFGTMGTQLNTFDGGRTWLPRTGYDFTYGSADFFNQDRGLLADRTGRVYLTLDGGRSWKSVHQSERAWTSAACLDDQKAWVVSYDGHLITTDDGGQSWQAQDIPTPTNWFTYASNPAKGVLYGSERQILFYDGKTWQHRQLDLEWESPPPNNPSRGRYAREFRDFTQALKPMALVVFFDDLDRCNPETTLRTLEAVNYLASSGDCYIILGMAYEVVKNNVAVAYKDLAKQMLEDKHDAQGKHFAAEYLEKMVNIQVPVPLPENTQLLGLAEPPEPEPLSRAAVLAEWFSSRLRRWGTHSPLWSY